MSVRSRSVVTLMLLLGVMGCSPDKAGGHANNASPGIDSPAQIPDLFSGMWLSFSSFVEDDAKLNVPYTASAQKYVDAYRQRRDIPYAEEGCKSPGLPIAMRMGQVKFTQAPGLISIYMQSAGDSRFIRMNKKQGKTSPRYYGNSVGHWEGDTLVVETVDFVNGISFQYGVGKPLPPAETVGTASLGPPPAALLNSLSAAIWGPHGEGMRMVERMRLVDPDTLEHKLTIYDDSVWTKPYVMSTRNYKRMTSAEPEEWVCSVSITSFDPDTNSYVDKDPEAMVKYLDKLGR
jgi:hypothetical protein